VQLLCCSLPRLLTPAPASLAAATLTAAATAKDAANVTYILFGQTNATGGAVVDNRQVFASAALACTTVYGTLANFTDASAPFLAHLFQHYMTTVAGATTQWGSRRTCAWVGLSNLAGTGMPLTSALMTAPTNELVWAEDGGSKCGAVSFQRRPDACVNSNLYSN
jgi:hypothetical protein